MQGNEFQGEYYDPSSDEFEKASFNKPRGPRLTLRHLNKLKKMRAAKDLEDLIRADFMEIIYGAPAEEAGGLGGAGF